MRVRGRVRVTAKTKGQRGLHMTIPSDWHPFMPVGKMFIYELTDEGILLKPSDEVEPEQVTPAWAQSNESLIDP